jgi:hypothetical protein
MHIASAKACQHCHTGCSKAVIRQDPKSVHEWVTRNEIRNMNISRSREKSQDKEQMSGNFQNNISASLEFVAAGCRMLIARWSRFKITKTRPRNENNVRIQQLCLYRLPSNSPRTPLNVTWQSNVSAEVMPERPPRKKRAESETIPGFASGYGRESQ